MANENLMEYINELAETNEDEEVFKRLSIINRSWLSGLAEYAFNQKGKTPPSWVQISGQSPTEEATEVYK